MIPHITNSNNSNESYMIWYPHLTNSNNSNKNDVIWYPIPPAHPTLIRTTWYDTPYHQLKQLQWELHDMIPPSHQLTQLQLERHDTPHITSSPNSNESNRYGPAYRSIANRCGLNKLLIPDVGWVMFPVVTSNIRRVRLELSCGHVWKPMVKKQCNMFLIFCE